MSTRSLYRTLTNHELASELAMIEQERQSVTEGSSYDERLTAIAAALRHEQAARASLTDSKQEAAERKRQDRLAYFD